MASERFGTGFCFARQLSTAAIISSLKRSRGEASTSAPALCQGYPKDYHNQENGHLRPIPTAPDPILKLVVTASLAAAFEDEVAIRELIGDRNCCDPYFHAPLRFQEREFFLGQGWGFRSVDDVDPVCRREAKQIKAVIRDTCRR